jgi:hypothetical protein
LSAKTITTVLRAGENVVQEAAALRAQMEVDRRERADRFSREGLLAADRDRGEPEEMQQLRGRFEAFEDLASARLREEVEELFAADASAAEIGDGLDRLEADAGDRYELHRYGELSMQQLAEEADLKLELRTWEPGDQLAATLVVDEGAEPQRIPVSLAAEEPVSGSSATLLLRMDKSNIGGTGSTETDCELQGEVAADIIDRADCLEATDAPPPAPTGAAPVPRRREAGSEAS